MRPVLPQPLTIEYFQRRSVLSDETGCWEWSGARNAFGYGVFAIKKRPRLAHRMAYMVRSKAELPPSVFVCHRCDNPSCVNPDHLFAGTHTDNMRDMCAKGRAVKERPARRGELCSWSKLTAADVIVIRGCSDPATVLARRFNVSPKTIRSVRKRRIWAHLD